MLEQYISNEYLRGFAIILIVFIAIRIIMFILGKVLPVLTKNTKTQLDDEILRKTSMPITLLAVLAGIRFAIGEIGLQETTQQTVNGIILTFAILFGAILLYHILDSLIVIGYRDFGQKIKGKVNESLLQFFHSMLKIIMITAAFLVILSSWGIEIGPLLAGIGVAGLAVAFALQPTLANIFGGISMLLDRSINVGDLVNLEDGTAGKILKINLRSTKVKTFDNELVIVPNSKLADSNIKNVALPTPLTRVVIPFGVAYGSNIDKVKKIVLSEVKKINNVVEDPEAAVKFLEMANSSLNFKAYIYVKSFDDKLSALDEANTRIYNALNKAGIEIPFPQMDVHVKK